VIALNRKYLPLVAFALMVIAYLTAMVVEKTHARGTFHTMGNIAVLSVPGFALLTLGTFAAAFFPKKERREHGWLFVAKISAAVVAFIVVLFFGYFFFLWPGLPATN
jgi:heme/copper-type cytochrome/quinol oxidase subunit 4